MRRRWVVLLGAAVFMGVAALGVVLLLPESERVCRANYERITTGMLASEVEVLLGEPVGQEQAEGQHIGYASRAFWHGGQGLIEVHFDERGGVLDACFVEFTPAPRGPWQSLRAALGW